jgi:hypothetical protein
MRASKPLRHEQLDTVTVKLAWALPKDEAQLVICKKD